MAARLTSRTLREQLPEAEFGELAANNPLDASPSSPKYPQAGQVLGRAAT
ncbi:MAG: hypothetical protein ACXVHL_33530 [Solirubrobacteraceae bacterium]